MSHPEDRIRRRREALGMSQLDLSQKLGYTDRSTIAKLEAGVNHVNTKKLPALAKALETTVSYLMCETDDYYDYELDNEHRLKEIPDEIFRNLYPRCKGNTREIWHAYLRGEGKPEPVFDAKKELRFALFGGYEDVTDEMFEEVLQFASFVKTREEMKKKNP